MIGVQARDGVASADVTFTAGVNGLTGPICVVGDFNGWDPYAHQMPWSGGAHRVTLRLDVGCRYVFQYLAADGYWFNDEAADDYELNEFGGLDSVLDLRTPRHALNPRAARSQAPGPEGVLLRD